MTIRREHVQLILILLKGIVERILKFYDSGMVMDIVAFSRFGKNLVESGKYVFYVLFTPWHPCFLIFIVSPYMMFIKDYTGKFSLSCKRNVSLILGELSREGEYHDVVNTPDNLYDRAVFSLNENKTQLMGGDGPLTSP